MKFKIGDKVKKVTGDYKFEGYVVSIFSKLPFTNDVNQRIRIVVENSDGILHIYNEKNLELY